MAKKLTTRKVFYRASKEFRMQYKPFRFVEFWLKHSKDSVKDVRFYIRWRSHEEFVQAWDFIRSIDKSDYEDQALIRSHLFPRTRKEKAIHQSQMSGLRHLSEII